MNKGDFVSKLAERTDLSVNKANAVVKELESIIIEELQAGGEVVLTGFMSFKTGIRAERKGKNLQTGEDIIIPEAKVVKLKAGKNLKDSIN